MPTELSRREFSWVLGGPQGGGINASAEVYAKALARGGLHVFANIEFHSNIMGKHSYYRVTAAQLPVHSHVDDIHMLVALDQESLFGDAAERKHYPSHTGHVHQVAAGGGVIYDADLKIDPAQFGRDDINLYPIPFFELLEQALKQVGKGGQSRKYIVMRNTVALGASIGISGYDEELLFEAIRDEFKGRKAEAAEMNVAAVRVAAAYARSQFGARPTRTLAPLPAEKRTRRLLIKGFQAVGIAKLKAGLGLQTYYPISPATDESVYLEAKGPHYQCAVVQCEDEIASINMAIGAAHMGVRAATSTAGPGFALMSEGFGFAAITEAPGPVVFLWQRGGPSTGLPTRTEQADLQFALHPAHGDFPHIVVASGDIEEAFADSFESFNWADRYQVPVVVLLEKFLASSLFTIDPMDMTRFKVDRGLIHQANGDGDGYRRHALTADGISPRTLPGMPGGIFSTTSDEHDPEGHITEGIENRIAMMRKRMAKLDTAAKEIPASTKFTLHGPRQAELTLVGWGATKGAILDAMAELELDGRLVNFLQIRLMRPFPSDAVAAILRSAEQTVLIENNYSAQLGALITEHTGVVLDHHVLKYDGRPFSRNEIVEGVRAALSERKKEVMVSHA
ncbi:MAG TPA: 2-oxoacid:acceptor oxidoreductase subunit alpha [Candidatus Dormibacteraeota bacterium]|nr:2-oxoacid:acceptor oxidoreductase subunit alpha [Candidatus Dormibacteraeota bacterium]